jgi:membrane associated rhomboid family serine protease
VYYELALISVAIAGGYWGWFFVRQEASRLYGAMLLGSGVLGCLGLLGRKEAIDSLGVPGAIGVGAGACLLIVGPLVRGLARRAAGADHFGIADKLFTVADVLAPGSGVREEKALLGAMQAIRDGQIEHTIDALEHAKKLAPDDARLAIDERIAMLYLAAYRWDDAVRHAEAHLFGALGASADEPGRHVALRRALGVAPPVWVELLAAYGYLGNLEQAAHMLARLEDVCAGRDDAAMWLHRGRMMFLALAGRPEAVRALVERKRSRHMTSSSRIYWVAVAHERHGDRSAAEAAYTKARSQTRGRPRVLLERAFARLPTAHEVELGAMAREVVARVEAAPVPEVAGPARRRTMVATRTLAVALMLPAIATMIFVGPSSDFGVLIRSGALLRGFVHDEPWRLVSCMFVHVGAVHLLVNVMGLWFLGRLAEDLFGPWRLSAIFAISGLVGSLASWMAAPFGISAGASGAIFGVLGALFVELTWQRRRYRAAWSRGIWGSVALVTVAQVAIGFLYPVTDQWAHAGGLATGAVLGIVMSPHLRGARWIEHVARAIAIGFAMVVIASAVLVVRTSIVDSLTRNPEIDHSVGTLHVRAPASWKADDLAITDPDKLVELHVGRSAGVLASQLADAATAWTERSKKVGFDAARPATERLVPLPPGWEGVELELTATDALEVRQHFRLVVAGRVDGSGVVLCALYVPETFARDAPSFFTDLLGSVR